MGWLVLGVRGWGGGGGLRALRHRPPHQYRRRRRCQLCFVCRRCVCCCSSCCRCGRGRRRPALSSRPVFQGLLGRWLRELCVQVGVLREGRPCLRLVCRKQRPLRHVAVTHGFAHCRETQRTDDLHVAGSTALDVVEARHGCNGAGRAGVAGTAEGHGVQLT